MRQSLFATILLLCTSVCSHAQWRGAVVENPGLSAGFDAEVRDIAQDSSGYIYFATDQGLYQYDGNIFRFFGHDPEDTTSIPSGQIFRLCVSHDNLIWMTLYQSGLVSYDPLTDKFGHYPLAGQSATEHSGAISVCEDADKTSIWVGSYTGRLIRFDRKTHTHETFMPDFPAHESFVQRQDIIRVIQDRFHPETLWLTLHWAAHPDAQLDHTGIASFDKSTQTFTLHACNGNIEFQDHNGTLWSSIWDPSITMFVPGEGQCESYSFADHLPRPPVSRRIAAYGDEMIVAAHAVLKFDPSHGFTPLTSFGDRIGALSLLVDHSDNLWIGTDNGVRVLDPDNQHIGYYSLDIFDVSSRLYPARLAYHRGSETIFLAQSNTEPFERIFGISADPGRQHSKEINTPFRVHGIATDLQDRIWLAGREGFFLMDPVTFHLKPSDLSLPGDTLPWLWNMRTHVNGWLGALGDSVFYWFHPETKLLQHLSILELEGRQTTRTFTDFTFSKRNEAILVARDQVYSLELGTGKKTLIRWPPGSLEDQFELVHCVQRATDGVLWVLTFTTLFAFEDNDGALRKKDAFTLKDGLASPTMQEFHVDVYGRIWIFSSSGLNCIDPVTREIRHFSTREGLPISFIDPRQVIDVPEAGIATVCGNGLIQFDAAKLWHSKDPQDVSVVIKDIRVNGFSLQSDTAITSLDRITLPKGTKVVDVQFQGLVFPNDINTTYSYRLSGTNPEWIDIGTNSFVTLPTLPYGTTTLEIKAALPEHDGPVRRVRFTTPTPLHAQRWFVLAMALLILTSGYLLYRLRVQQIRRTEKEKTRINKQFAELELKALRSQMNPHFMFNSLNSIKTYILEAKPDVAADYLSQFAHLIRRILQNSREQLISLQEETETLMLYISLEQFRFENAFEVEYEISRQLDLDEIMIPPMLLQPHVENAIWHGLRHRGKGGLLKLHVRQTNGSVKCIIEDNGIGRKKSRELKSLSATKHKSMGMGITQSRIDLMASTTPYQITIDVIDKTDGNGNALGTIVEIEIPVVKHLALEHQ